MDDKRYIENKDIPPGMSVDEFMTWLAQYLFMKKKADEARAARGSDPARFGTTAGTSPGPPGTRGLTPNPLGGAGGNLPPQYYNPTDFGVDPKAWGGYPGSGAGPTYGSTGGTIPLVTQGSAPWKAQAAGLGSGGGGILSKLSGFWNKIPGPLQDILAQMGLGLGGAAFGEFFGPDTDGAEEAFQRLMDMLTESGQFSLDRNKEYLDLVKGTTFKGPSEEQYLNMLLGGKVGRDFDDLASTLAGVFSMRDPQREGELRYLAPGNFSSSPGAGAFSSGASLSSQQLTNMLNDMGSTVESFIDGILKRNWMRRLG